MPQNDMPLIAAGEMCGVGGRSEVFQIQISLRLPASLQETINSVAEVSADAGIINLTGPGQKAEEMAHVAKRVMRILMED